MLAALVPSLLSHLSWRLIFELGLIVAVDTIYVFGLRKSVPILQLQFTLLTILLLYMSFRIYDHISTSWDYLMQIYSGLHHIIIPPDAPAWFSWFWGFYIGGVVSCWPLFVWLPKIRRIRRRVPIAKLSPLEVDDKVGLWVMRKFQRPRMELGAGGLRETDAEKAGGKDKDKPQNSPREIISRTSKMRRGLALYSLNNIWLLIAVIETCCPVTLDPWAGVPLDHSNIPALIYQEFRLMLPLGLPFTWVDSLLRVVEAWTEHRKARAMQADGVWGESSEAAEKGCA